MQNFFIAIFILCSSLCSIQASSEASLKASNFVKNIVTEALEIVNNNTMQDEGKRKELSKCINKYLDVARITKSVFSPLGYKALTDADKKKVEAYLERYLIRFYAGEGKLSVMVNTKLDGEPVAKAMAKDKDFAVTTKLKKGGASKPTEIVWITDGQKIYYVEIAGINQIITLRAEMSSAVGSSLMDYINAQEQAS